jgi:DNA repair exonuclease SbcCD ATPase subunit
MKRAFDDNLPRVKPRVRFSAETTALEELETSSESASTTVNVVVSSVDAQRLAQHVLGSPLSSRGIDEEAEIVARAHPIPEAPRAAAPVSPRGDPPRAPPTAPAPNGRTEAHATEGAQRREKLRSRLRSLSSGPVQRPTGNPEAVLNAAEELVEQLAVGRATIARLEADLRSARRDLETSVTEAEMSRQEGETLRGELGETRALLGTLETELGALEAERDEVLYEVRQLREAESARSESLANLSRELDEARRELLEKQSDETEILNELQQSDAERTALKAEVQRLEQERARNLQEIEATAVAEGQLREQKGTLSRVHQVLAAARKS